MMVLCKNRCIYSNDTCCTREIIRLDSSGTCEQYSPEDTAVLPLVKDVVEIMVKNKPHKAPRSGKSLI